jgi:hypothetical protein
MAGSPLTRARFGVIFDQALQDRLNELDNWPASLNATHANQINYNTFFLNVKGHKKIFFDFFLSIKTRFYLMALF